MSKYKYQIENGILMEASHLRLIQQNDFRNEIINKKVSEEEAHIYMVCSRPKISFDPKSIIINEDYVEGSFIINKAGFEELHDFKKPNPPELKITNYSLEYPYKDISFLNENGKEVSGGKAPYLYPHLIDNYNQNLDLKVHYIGQAFGNNGERLAVNRLASHSTLQEIYADVMHDLPDEEVWLVLLNFENYSISMAGENVSNASSSLEESLNHFMNFSTNPISFDQEITLTEAALIRYFEPSYNEKYKTTFPSSSHSSYNQCYKLDINSIAFNLDTTNIITQLYSEKIEPLPYHNKIFPLHSTTQRKSMFEGLNNLESE